MSSPTKMFRLEAVELRGDDRKVTWQPQVASIPSKSQSIDIFRLWEVDEHIVLRLASIRARGLENDGVSAQLPAPMKVDYQPVRLLIRSSLGGIHSCSASE